MTVVCIAGMHRSGTSMIARLLNLCGLYLGQAKDLLPPAPDNPEGFWENANFVELNDTILTELGGGWDELPDSPPGWESDPKLLPYYRRGVELIEELKDREPWGWKDPRNSVTIEFWRKLIPELKVVICLRNPLAVAKSLTKRGFSSPAFGLNLWSSNYNRLLRAVPVEHRIITHYDSYFAEPRAELTRLLDLLQMPVTDQQLDQALSTIATPLKHHTTSLFDLLDHKPPLELIQLYQNLCSEAGPVYAASLGTDSLVPDLSQGIYRQYVETRERDRLAREVKVLSAQKEMAIAEKEKAIAEKEVTIREKDALLGALGAMQEEWDAQKATRGWKALEQIRAWKLRIWPPGSRRQRYIGLPFRALRVWRNEGFQGVSARLASRAAQHMAVEGTTPAYEITDTEPIASIVIPVFNCLDLTTECIDSIYRNTPPTAFEVIVVDNASSDETPTWLQSQKEKRPNLETIRMPENVGFGPAVNVGIQKSKADRIVILNNDTLVTPGWLDNMLAVVETDPSVGIVSPVTNYVGEGPQIDPAAAALPPDPEVIEKYVAGIQDRCEVYYEPNRLVFFCVLIQRSLVDRIGSLDTSYERGNFEDDDYCLRARMAGYRLAIAPNSFVYHRGSATFVAGNISHTHYMEQNRGIFYRKVGRIATAAPQFGAHRPLRKNVVSVIVRTVNRPRLLQNALTSLVNQTYPDFEVVVVNDGGDDIAGLLEPFDDLLSLTYARNSTPRGRSAALDIGIEHSRGSWICYLDDDDIVYPWHLEALVQAAQASAGKFVYSDYNKALFLASDPVTPTKLVGAPPWDYARQQLLVQNYIPIHTWLHARGCVEDAGGWDRGLDRLEDYDFLLRLSAKCRFYHLHKVTCEYRYYLHSANSIYTERSKTLEALNGIYQRHPVADQELLARRRSILAALEDQVKAIQSLEKRVGDSMTEAQMTREVMRLVVGL